ncbi:HD domain-containing protein [Segetibacter sp. 3557_3]|uniref:HD domain-containing protein n=1 Tax=Segetibacter sp. 3557_3 TaxID=2547429 RepID=UPI0010585E4B|nr:HD domain-containing protein [Segetibacter sp. 3557_3]TDH19832.1 HD domain-containing protein [Segetibacter sp. 3557_3]
MPDALRKIINDPVYGFITIQDPLIFSIMNHPYYQRLRRIHQMAMAHLVYPGAVHTRLHHSLGAYHLAGCAITELRNKGVEITSEEAVATEAAILLHDIGHGPFSHALESVLLPGTHHEQVGLQIIQRMNAEMNGRLDMAIAIFTNKYHKHFLHQLVSGQLDVDRMDYLTRDSFFTGVSEGVIGYDRILKMLTVYEGELLVEEKGIYSIEKFLIARRLMYWQVYLHKTVLVSEKMLVNIVRRVRQINHKSDSRLVTNTPMDYFLRDFETMNDEALTEFCTLDDYDFMHAVKTWSRHPDPVLHLLCTKILNRDLLKIRVQAEPFEENEVQQKLAYACHNLNVSEDDGKYFVFTGIAANTMYSTKDERINILFKDGTIKDISEIDNALIHKTLASPIKKFYICYHR